MNWKAPITRVGESASAAASAAWKQTGGRLSGLSRRSGVVSIFLDGPTVSVAVLRLRNRTPRVEMTALLRLEADTLADAESAGRALADALKEVKNAPDQLVVSVGTELTFERRVVLPAMTPEETDAAVMFQADRVLPFPTAEMRIDYVVQAADGAEAQTVAISAIAEQTARSIEILATSAALSLAAVYQGASALYTAVATSSNQAVGTPRALIYGRHEGVEMALGSAEGVLTSRFVRSNASSAPSELSRTAAAAGIAADGGMAVFASRDLVCGFDGTGTSFDVTPIEETLAAFGAVEGSTAAVAAASGALYLNRASLPNFHESSLDVRRKGKALSKRARAGRYAATAMALPALVAISGLGYWGYVRSLESKADALETANGELKASLARAEAGRPWISDRLVLVDVLAGVTNAFPRSSQAFVKSLSVAESGKVSIQGRMPTAQAAYDLVADLSKTSGLQNVKLDTGSADSSGGYSFALSFEIEKWKGAQ